MRGWDSITLFNLYLFIEKLYILIIYHKEGYHHIYCVELRFKLITLIVLVPTFRLSFFRELCNAGNPFRNTLSFGMSTTQLFFSEFILLQNLSYLTTIFYTLTSHIISTTFTPRVVKYV